MDIEDRDSSEARMPEGWKRFYKPLYDCDYHKLHASEIHEVAELMKEMAEALEATSVVYYEASSKLTGEDLKRPHIFRHDFLNYKIIEDHNIRAFKAIEALKKFMEWK